jgi:chromosome segregation ATPase
MPQPGATESQGQPEDHDTIKTELASIDAALADLNKRLEGARDSVKADLQQQLTVLQKRDDELKAKLKATETGANAQAEKVRDQIHQGLIDLRNDMNKLTDRIQQR